MSEKKNSEESGTYLHGYTEKEQQRLVRQARNGEYVIFQNVNFSNVKNLIEVGCGVGAQSEVLLRRFPNLHLTGLDIGPEQLKFARKYLESKDYCQGRYHYERMDASNLKFAPNQFDGAFLCWVLEHVPDPSKVLSEVRRVLLPGSEIVINEVMNSSFFLDPYGPSLWKYWMAYNDYQCDHGGDPFIGVKLGNLLLGLGFQQIETEVKVIHIDNRHPGRRKTMIEHWSDLLLSAADRLKKGGYVDDELINSMKEELASVASDPNAVFFNSFMQARARVY